MKEKHDLPIEVAQANIDKLIRLFNLIEQRPGDFRVDVHLVDESELFVFLLNPYQAVPIKQLFAEFVQAVTESAIAYRAQLEAKK